MGFEIEKVVKTSIYGPKTVKTGKKPFKKPKARKARRKVEKLVAPSFSAGFFLQNNFLFRCIQNRPPISTNKPLWLFTDLDERGVIFASRQHGTE